MKLKNSIGIILIFMLFLSGTEVKAAGSIIASGGGNMAVDEVLTITIEATGAEFNAIEGQISITGPVEVEELIVGADEIYWIAEPREGGKFIGAFLGSPRSSYTIATIKLRGLNNGSGEVIVDGVKLVNAGEIVGDVGVGVDFTIGDGEATSAPDVAEDNSENLPKVEVTSQTHPKSMEVYSKKDVELKWNRDTGVTGFSYVLDQNPDTIPPSKIKSNNTSEKYGGLENGSHYFHIKAINDAGWGDITHFQFNIGDEPLCNIMIQDLDVYRHDRFVADVQTNQVYGIVISGETESDQLIELIIDPEPVLPEDRTLTATSDTDGYFQYDIDFPLAVGIYQLSANVVKEGGIKCPLSKEIHFNISADPEGVEVIGELGSVGDSGLDLDESGNDLEVDRKNLYYIGALGFLGVLIYWIFRSSKKKKRTNNRSRSQRRHKKI